MRRNFLTSSQWWDIIYLACSCSLWSISPVGRCLIQNCHCLVDGGKDRCRFLTKKSTTIIVKLFFFLTDEKSYSRIFQNSRLELETAHRGIICGLKLILLGVLVDFRCNASVLFFRAKVSLDHIKRFLVDFSVFVTL